MASTAKNTSKKSSYAEMAKKTSKKAYFEVTECALKTPPNLPSKQIPNTNEKYSFFVSLDTTNATQWEIAQVMPSGVVGVVPRLDLRTIEFVCKDEDTVKKATSEPFKVEGKKPFYGILPRHLCSKVLLVKLANVPFGTEETLKKVIGDHWGKYGEVVDIAPHKFLDKPWLTKRWDLLLKLPMEAKKLKAEPVFKLEGFEATILATWPNAPKSCLRCLVAGHSTSSCPKNSPKVGETARPLQKIDKEDKTQKGKEKGSEVPTVSSDKPKAPTTLATKATPATVAKPAPVAQSPATSSSWMAATFSGEELEVAFPTSKLTGTEEQSTYTSSAMEVETVELPSALRMSTPPPFSVEDPDTPRKGDKRMAKGEASRPATYVPWKPSDQEIKEYAEGFEYCFRCWCEHEDAECPRSDEPIDWQAVFWNLNFDEIWSRWQRNRKKKGRSWKLDREVADIAIPAYCFTCKAAGHKSGDPECPRQ